MMRAKTTLIQSNFLSNLLHLVKSLIHEYELRCTSHGKTGITEDDNQNNSWYDEVECEKKEDSKKKTDDDDEVSIEAEFLADTPLNTRKRSSRAADFSSPEEDGAGPSSGSGSGSGGSPDLFATVKRAKKRINRQRHIISMYADAATKKKNP